MWRRSTSRWSLGLVSPESEDAQGWVGTREERSRRMGVSLIIVNWNGRRFVEACLLALQRQTVRPLEIIVVDNGSTDGSPEFIRSTFPDVRLIALNRNTGFAAGNNIGIREAHGEYLALLNNDTEPEPLWLEELHRAIREYPEAGICASKIVSYDTPARIDSAGDEFWTVGVAVKRGDGEIDAWQYAQPGWVFGASAAAALYRRSLFEAVGGFDERFSPAYHEDTDFNFRAQLQGYRCRYVPTAIVRHHISATLGRGNRCLLSLRARNGCYVMVKNLPTRLWRKYGVRIVMYHVLTGMYYFLTGRGPAYLFGGFSALGAISGLLRDRATIQKQRVVTDERIEEMLTPIEVGEALGTQWRRRRARRG